MVVLMWWLLIRQIRTICRGPQKIIQNRGIVHHCWRKIVPWHQFRTYPWRLGRLQGRKWDSIVTSLLNSTDELQFGKEKIGLNSRCFTRLNGYKFWLSMWLSRDQSNSLCISLACYKLSDVIQASFKHDDDANFVFGTEQLLYLNSTWPTDGGIIATFGNHRISLAPPRFVSGASFTVSS